MRTSRMCKKVKIKPEDSRIACEFCGIDNHCTLYKRFYKSKRIYVCKNCINNDVYL